MRRSSAITSGSTVTATKALSITLLVASFCFWFEQTGAADDLLGPSRRGAKLVSPIVAEVRELEGFDPQESAGLFVGVRKFESPEFSQVPFAVDDAIDLAYLFTEELGLLTSGNVTLSLSGEAEKETSKIRLRELKKRGAQVVSAKLTTVFKLIAQKSRLVGPQGMLFVTVATHGFSDDGTDVLVTQDSVPEFMKNTGIPVSVLLDTFSKANSPRRVILLDACRERLNSMKRAVRQSPNPKSAMSLAFYNAISDASGQAIIAASTLGGYAYDDFSKKNGVFSAALVDGLRGSAPPNHAGLITIRTLGDFVNEKVLTWIKENQPAGAEKSLGVTTNFEGLAAQMPLAIHMETYYGPKGYRARRDAAVRKLRKQLKDKIGANMLVKMEDALSHEDPNTFRTELITEILIAGDSDRDIRILTDYFATHGQPLDDIRAFSQ